MSLVVLVNLPSGAFLFLLPGMVYNGDEDVDLGEGGGNGDDLVDGIGDGAEVLVDGVGDGGDDPDDGWPGR